MKGLKASFGTDITRVEVSIQRGTVMLEKGGESMGVIGKGEPSEVTGKKCW